MLFKSFADLKMDWLTQPAAVIDVEGKHTHYCRFYKYSYFELNKNWWNNKIKGLPLFDGSDIKISVLADVRYFFMCGIYPISKWLYFHGVERKYK